MAMNNLYNYSAINLETGEEIRGTSTELAKFFNTKTRNINKYALEGLKLHGVWQIKKETDEGIYEESKMYRISEDILAEWDRVTEPFKRASRKGAKA